MIWIGYVIAWISSAVVSCVGMYVTDSGWCALVMLLPACIRMSSTNNNEKNNEHPKKRRKKRSMLDEYITAYIMAKLEGDTDKMKIIENDLEKIGMDKGTLYILACSILSGH